MRQILDPEEVQNVLLNTKLINDTYSQFADLSHKKVRTNYEKIFR